MSVAAAATTALLPAGDAKGALLLWNFTDGNAVVDSGTPVNFTVSGFSIGNTLGTVATPINGSSPSTTAAYPSASGTNNIGNAARVGAMDTTTSAYYEVSFTPDAGYKIEVDDFDFGTRSTSTGPQAYVLLGSNTNYSTSTGNVYASGTIPNTSTWVYKDNTVTSFTGGDDTPLTIRLYMYSGTGTPTAGTINSRLDDIGITVLAVPTPEPASAGVFIGGVGTIAAIGRRRRRGC